MQKKIIALAIASALAAPVAAFAEVSVYGLVDLSIDVANDGAVTNGATTNQLNSNASRIGFKGSEDLGGGMSAVWQMEGTVAMDAGAGGGTSTTATALFDRNTFVGLSSEGMGTLILGQHDTPYKMSTRKLDLFADSAADNRRYVMSSYGHDGVLSNVLAYVSPDMGGLSVAAATAFGAETAANGDVKGSALSLAGMCSQGPIYATLAYQSLKQGQDNAPFQAFGTGDLDGVADDEDSAIKLGGSYTMDQLAVNLVIEKTTDKVAAATGDTTGTNFYLGGQFNVSSSDAVKLAYGKHGESDTAGSGKNTDGASQVSIGYDHGMSKATTVYALYTKVSGQDAGLIKNPDPSWLSVGIKHAF